MTGTEALARATRRLAEAGVAEAARDARRLLAHALDIAPGRLSLAAPEPLTELARGQFERLVEARASRVPVSHLTGTRSFWGRDFRVTPDVLDPRPETETLVAEALSASFTRVLDLGTGSGCILLSILAEAPEATGLGTDISGPALAVARENSARLGLEGRAELREGTWVGPLAADDRFDLVVSNPPYIAAAEMAGLAPEVRNHEPPAALTDNGDGLSAYRAIAAAVPGHMTPGARILVEIGESQGEAVARIFATAGLTEPRILPDLDGRDRVVMATNAGIASN
ncbi:peptide chain release factor N(5)-glutamine methyltransferase [Roseivivax sediminis]|uniref:Release factor glutamine methyltransferase n=1 Tax=Roseivivax sediminis TaxID=936889 RepID=A0A1I1Y4K0_9RHOB|nr:peptide chain release factor N(5)-glutamine methyltransferase [Roseivivax sediminis]SFE13928.1 [protein release factor]-glutamine N5-methyltransferase [Roseivivax sediminis]